MRRWSELAERLAATTRTSEKTALLAEYLRSLTPDELPIAAVFLTGRPFAEADQRAAGLGWSAIATTVTQIGDVPRSALGEAYDRSSDLGIAVAEVLRAAGHAPPPEASPTLPEVAAAFGEIEAASGAARKSAILRSLLERADSLTAKYIVKVLGGDLRIGLREGLVEAAIARAFDRPLDDVKWAGMLVGDVGRLAGLARDDALGSASLALFHPLKFMLASPAEDAAEIITRLGPEVWVEDKYDGIRAQLHKRGDEVRLYSRDLHDISAGYPEIVGSAAPLAWDGILDGEILAWRDGIVLPFIALQGRLGRKTPSAAIQAEVPVIYVAFDALALGPGDDEPVEPLLRTPLAERRARLDALDLPLTDDGGRFARSHLIAASDADGSRGGLRRRPGAAQRRADGQGPDEPLRAGPARSRLAQDEEGARHDRLRRRRRRGRSRQAPRGPERLHVRRPRHGERDRFVNIGKAYSGLTDAEIAEMTRWFEAHTLSRHGRYHVVEPTVVVEIAFDVIVRSTRHGSGFSLRFPRIVALRPDKTVDEIDTVETVTALYEGLQHGAELLVTAGSKARTESTA